MSDRALRALENLARSGVSLLGLRLDQNPQRLSACTANTTTRRIMMRDSHLLLDIFEAAIEPLRAEPARHSPEDLERTIDEAIESVARHYAKRLRETAKANRGHLERAVAEWDRKRAPVRLGWDR
jgi:hypothetical protein